MEKRFASNKFLLFVLKYKLPILLGAFSLFNFLAGFWWPFCIFSCVLVCLSYLFLKPNEIICALMYSMFFSQVEYYFMFNMVGSVVSMIIHYAIDVKNNKNKVYKVPLFLTLAILILFSLIHYGAGQKGFEQGMTFISVLVLFYLFFALYREIDINKAFNFLFAGLIVSTALSLVTFLFPSYGFRIVYVDEVCRRLQLFVRHTNHLSMLCLFLIAYQVHQIANKRGKLVLSVVEIIFALVVGLLTLSKAFIVVCVGFAFYSIICLLSKYKWKSFRVIIPLSVFLVILSIIFKDKVKYLIERFFAYNKTKSIINQITTGRSAIWFQYMELVRSSVAKMLFGVGLFTDELVSIGTHSSYLFILSRIGFIGIIMLLCLIWSYFKCSTRKFKINFFNILPMLTYLILSIEEMIFNERFIIFFIFALIFMLEPENGQDEESEDFEKLEKLINKDIKLNKILKNKS